MQSSSQDAYLIQPLYSIPKRRSFNNKYIHISRDLVQDDTVKPISGHVLRVEAPWIKMTMAKGQGLQTCMG